jgi:uncharacterized membrane protein YgdD (TMEM256/DUF423 family)
MHRLILFFTGISGALVVAIGAIGAHTLREHFHLPEKNLMVYETAVRYQAYHTLALLGLSFWMFQFPSKIANAASVFFISGILLFSGSLYFLALRPLMGLADDQAKWMGIFTPFGGLAFISGWVLIVIYALKLKK